MGLSNYLLIWCAFTVLIINKRELDVSKSVNLQMHFDFNNGCLMRKSKFAKTKEREENDLHHSIPCAVSPHPFSHNLLLLLLLLCLLRLFSSIPIPRSSPLNFISLSPFIHLFMHFNFIFFFSFAFHFLGF